MDGISLPELLLIAVSLSADCFAVSVSGSVAMFRLRAGAMLRTAAAFGFAQFLMPVIGWFLGRTVVDLIASFDHWVAFGLLAFVGGRMIWESLRQGEENRTADISRGLLLFTLAVATSIDALAVGLSFALLQTNVWISSGVIGLVAFGVTCLGFVVGSKAGPLLGKRAKLAGGVILIGIGLRILITHLLGG